MADRGEREVRVPHRDEELVVERRPMVEEVVVRRRDAGEALGDSEDRRTP